jgi:hypothetical protein
MAGRAAPRGGQVSRSRGAARARGDAQAALPRPTRPQGSRQWRIGRHLRSRGHDRAATAGLSRGKVGMAGPGARAPVGPEGRAGQPAGVGGRARGGPAHLHATGRGPAGAGAWAGRGRGWGGAGGPGAGRLWRAGRRVGRDRAGWGRGRGRRRTTPRGRHLAEPVATWPTPQDQLGGGPEGQLPGIWLISPRSRRHLAQRAADARSTGGRPPASASAVPARPPAGRPARPRPPPGPVSSRGSRQRPTRGPPHPHPNPSRPTDVPPPPRPVGAPRRGVA